MNHLKFISSSTGAITYNVSGSNIIDVLSYKKYCKYLIYLYNISIYKSQEQTIKKVLSLPVQYLNDNICYSILAELNEYPYRRYLKNGKNNKLTCPTNLVIGNDDVKFSYIYLLSWIKRETQRTPGVSVNIFTSDIESTDFLPLYRDRQKEVYNYDLEAQGILYDSLGDYNRALANEIYDLILSQNISYVSITKRDIYNYLNGNIFTSILDRIDPDTLLISENA